MPTIKERPILFSGPMVQVLLNGSKTQTRRIVKSPTGTFEINSTLDNPKQCWLNVTDANEEAIRPLLCPYGQPGERLWVRETLFWSFCESDWSYQADNEPLWVDRPDDEYTAPILLKEKPAIPSIHMPREASRILLEIVSVRVERLQAISEADAQAEGAERGIYRPYGVNSCQLEMNQYGDYKDGFKFIWHNVNGPESWQANPWVWVVEFKQIDTTGKEVRRAQ